MNFTKEHILYNEYNDIIMRKNIILYKNKFIPNTDYEDIIEEIIEEPVIVMDTLSSCYSHALLDSCFPIFWVIQDLIREKLIDTSNVRIMIRDKHILLYPKQNLPLINKSLEDYNGVYSDIIHILTKQPIIFTHCNSKKYLIKTLFIYTENDNWQRSPWNCSNNYSSGRNIPLCSVRFNDTIIYDMLNKFRDTVLNNYSLTEKKNK